jgi:hypothetical protein
MAVCEIKCGYTFEINRSVGGHVNCVLRSLGVEVIKQEDVQMTNVFWHFNYDFRLWAWPLSN